MRLAPAPGILSRRCLGKVLLRLPEEATVELAGAAAEVWGLLERGATTEDVVARLAAVHDTPPAAIEHEVERLVASLLELRVVNQQAPPSDTAP